MAEQYLLRITAGPGYDLEDHVEVPVNKGVPPVKISSPLIDVELNVRIHNYSGLPHGSPSTSPYFAHEPHQSNDDQYSIAFRFALKEPFPGSDPPSSVGAEAGVKVEAETTVSPAGVSAHDLQFGNNLDLPILPGRLPPGIGTALSIVQWWVDPGLEGDVYSEKPYLYGPALSSFNAVRVGTQDATPDPGPDLDPDRGGLWIDEGAEGDEALSHRRSLGAPDGAAQRKRWALGKDAKDRWAWEFGRWYGADFFNSYIDFTSFSIRLPGFHLPVLRFWDGQSLRYVLRNRSTGQVYLVIQFSLIPKEDASRNEPSGSENVPKGTSWNRPPQSTQDGVTTSYNDVD